jgi:hypothetical protein
MGSAKREMKRAMVVKCGASVPHSAMKVTWRSQAEAMVRLETRGIGYRGDGREDDGRACKRCAAPIGWREPGRRGRRMKRRINSAGVACSADQAGCRRGGGFLQRR